MPRRGQVEKKSTQQGGLCSDGKKTSVSEGKKKETAEEEVGEVGEVGDISLASGAKAGPSYTLTRCIKMLPSNNKPANSPSLNNEVIRAETPSAAQGGVAVSIPHPDNPTKGSQRGDDLVFVVSSDDDMDSEDEDAYLYAALYEPKG